MKKVLLITLLALIAISVNLHAQTEDVDSLVNVLETQKMTSKEQLKLCIKIINTAPLYDLKKINIYIPKAITLAEKENDIVLISKLYYDYGNAYRKNGFYDTAAIYSLKSLEYVLNTDDQILLADIYNRLGNLYRKMQKLITAQDYFIKALATAEKIEYADIAIMASFNLGAIYRSLNNLEQSIYFHEKTKILAEKNDDYLGQLYALSELAFIYTVPQKNLDKALEYAQKELEISIANGNKKFEVNAKQSLGRIYSGQNNLDKALEYVNESLQIAREIGDKEEIANTLDALAIIYKKQNRYKECLVAATEAWQIDSVSMGYGSDIAMLLSIANIYLDNKNKAVYYLEKFREIMDENSAKDFQNSISDMEVKYETEKKELRIAALEKEKTLQRWLYGAGTVILLLILGVLFYRHRLNIQKRKQAEQQIKQLEQEKQLIAAKALLDGENAERERLARDLHDGLGGMLSVIKINLNNMQNYSVIEGQDVNLFHNAIDMLDQSIGELRRVSHNIMPYALMQNGLKSALEDFCRSIPEAHFNYIGESRRLDSKFEVLIYRCAHELINNAIKHAKATSINIQLIIDSGLISLSVYDNGAGFDTQVEVAGSGLENIRTRLATYNGKMNIYSSPEIGTEVSIEIEQQ